MRLFTFGCSNTAYHYPTWADIVGKNFSEFQNWGRPGAGNNYILNAINRCHLVNHFTPNDTIIILWSGLARIDYYQINEWSHFVNQYFDLKNKDMPFSCPIGYQWLSFAWIASAQHILDNLGVHYKMFHWQGFDTHTDPYQLYKPVLDRIQFAPLFRNNQKYQLHPQSLRSAKLLYDRISGESWPPLESILDSKYKTMELDAFVKKELDDFYQMVEDDKNLSSKIWQTVDEHPSPLKHLEWAQTHLAEYFISQHTKDWINTIDTKLKTGQPYEFSVKHF